MSHNLRVCPRGQAGTTCLQVLHRQHRHLRPHTRSSPPGHLLPHFSARVALKSTNLITRSLLKSPSRPHGLTATPPEPPKGQSRGAQGRPPNLGSLASARAGRPPFLRAWAHVLLLHGFQLLPLPRLPGNSLLREALGPSPPSGRQLPPAEPPSRRGQHRPTASALGSVLAAAAPCALLLPSHRGSPSRFLPCSGFPLDL